MAESDCFVSKPPILAALESNMFEVQTSGDIRTLSMDYRVEVKLQRNIPISQQHEHLREAALKQTRRRMARAEHAIDPASGDIGQCICPGCKAPQELLLSRLSRGGWRPKCPPPYEPPEQPPPYEQSQPPPPYESSSTSSEGYRSRRSPPPRLLLDRIPDYNPLNI
ncbi:hypothetical protein P170DRAFT_478203 [Aspergillus steynii IBT 23096]|uniref:Uncharacterized protein n=1 Tax=Aspergillus steynii IBT 23096 TaxID=1392250 RepID=A0A2I2G3A1_9EURO|nr:uncharacterized protein P170DRAFT_478203 [Aspergillus steynii IBT 23096]PLB47351.1 hypothetical protein P170DRAFT_478203 [Aspergillus steynii IBT 23096]